MKIFRPFCACFVALACASVALAANDVWDANGLNPPTGIWGTNANWTDNTTPGNADTATFNLGAAYTVIFNANPLAIQALTVTGTVPTFTSSGGARTLSVTSATGGQDVTISGSILTLGTAGNPLHMTVGDNLTVNGGALLNAFSGSQVNTLDLILAQTGGNGTVVADGTGSQLNVTNNISMGLNGNTATLAYANNAQGTLNGAVTLAQSGNAASAATLSVASGADVMTGNLNVGTGTAAATGTLNITGSGSTLTQSGASTINVGTAAAGIGNINIGTTADGGVLTTGTGALTINATGTVNIGSGVTNIGRLIANGDVTIDGGTLMRDAGSTFALADGKTMTIENGGSASFINPYFTATNAIYNVSGPGSTLESVTGSIAINNAAQMNVSSGGLVSAAGIVSVGSGGNGTLTVDGSGSSLVSAGPTNTWGFSGNTAAVTFSNTSTGTLSGDLHLAETAIANTAAVVDVLSGADLSVGGNVKLTTAGGATNSATLNVEGSGTTFTQTGAGTLTVGHATTGSAVINIGTTTDGAVFTTGTGAMTVNATGAVNIGSGANIGTLNSNGNVLIDGGQLTVASQGIFNLTTGKTLTIDNGGSAVINRNHATATNTIYNVTGSGSQLETTTASGSLELSAGAELNVNSGGAVSTSGNFLMGSAGDGTLVVDGPGSTFTAGGNASLGGNGHTASVTFSDEAVGNFPILALSVSAFGATTAVFDVLSNADVSAFGLRVGTIAGPGASSTFNIEGAGSTVDITSPSSDAVNIGQATNGSASLNIGTTIDGSAFTSAGGIDIFPTGIVTVGSATTLGTLNANGNVLIDGGQLTVASQGVFNLATGKTLTIDNGGSAIINRNHAIPASSIYNVTGSGSDLITTGGSGTLSFGLGAELNVTSGGSVSTSGNFQMGSGALLVNGTGSTFTVGGTTASLSANGVNVAFSGDAVGNFPSLLLSASVGAASTVVFDVLSGADVDTTFGLDVGTIIGPSASATLNVEGAGSTFTVNDVGLDAVEIGHATNGSAALNIGTTTTGGTFTSAGGIEVRPTGTVTVGSGANTGTLNANGDVTIDGGTLTRGSGSSFILAAGKTMTIQNGGSARFNGVYLTASNAIYNVTGSGSTLEKLSTSAFFILSGAQVNVSSGASFSSAAGIVVGNGGNGTLTVDGAGSTATGMSTSFFGLAGNTANVTFSNGALGSFTDVDLATSTAGTTALVDVLSGADLNVNSLDLATGGGASTSATLNVNGSGSTVTTGGGVTVGHASTGTAVINIGNTATGGTFTSAGAIDIHPTGVVTVGSATTSGTLNANTSIAIDGGTIHLVDGVVNADSITVSGGGTFDFDGGTLHVQDFAGNLVNESGTLAPGQSPGITTVTGNYAQQNAGTLQIEIGGLTPGTQHDRLAVSSMLSLDGALDVLLINGFNPQSGNSFDILNWSILAGTFDALQLQSPGANLMWNSAQLYTDGVLRVALAGDYNLNGVVDAADYIVWRKALGQVGGPLAADGNGNGQIDSGDYNVWRNHFGQTAGSGSSASANAPVPEPATLVMLIVAAVGIRLCGRHSDVRVPSTR